MKKNSAFVPILLGFTLLSWSPVYAHLHDEFNTRTFTFNQNIIRGKITSGSGEALLGATVVNIKTSASAQTDQNGNYELTGTNGDQLRISMAGYATKTVTISGAVQNITLEDSEQTVDEIVVVGYGKQKKVNLTGAVAQIDSKVLEDRPVANATQALQGAVPNLNINFTNGRPGGEGKV
ncbi:MAG: carboxypeptidase-like regulatory domain-containing protein, partial [Sphingobacterium sp.]